MHHKKPSTIQRASASSDRGSRWLWVVVAGCVVVTLLGLLFPFANHRAESMENAAPPPDVASPADRSGRERLGPGRASRAEDLALSAEQIVSNKVVQFVRSRRELVGELAEHFRIEVPARVEQMLEVAEAGNWEEVETLFKMMRDERQKQEGPEAEAMAKFWPLLNETYGVMEEAHNWPAQKLLDYGTAILDSLRPDMVYAGGTDSGRFIPTLLNETSEGGSPRRAYAKRLR